MKSISIGKADQHILRLDVGDEVVASVSEFVKQKNILSGSIMGLGAVKDSVLGWFDPNTKEYSRKTMPEALELVGLTGTIAWFNDNPAVHMHVVVGDEFGRTYAGHLFSAVVAVLCEIVIQSGNVKVTRQKDQQFGLNFLDI